MLKRFKMSAGVCVLAALAAPVVAQQFKSAREVPQQSAPRNAVLKPQYLVALGNSLRRIDKSGTTNFTYQNGRIATEILNSGRGVCGPATTATGRGWIGGPRATRSVLLASAFGADAFLFMGVNMQTLGDVFEESANAATAGDYAKALELLIWIHDNPDPSHPSNEMFRRAYGFLALGVLAGVYEPAKKALINLVTKKREQVAAGLADRATEADLRALEEALRHAEE